MASPFVNPFRGHSVLSLLAALAGLAAYLALGVWLMEAADWTDACRPEGRKFAYMLSALSCSPYLLDRGLTGLGLFAWLWSAPVFILVVAVNAWRRPRRDPSSNSPE